MVSQSFVLRPVAPFNFEATAENQPYFRKGESDSTQIYERLLDLGDKLALAIVRSNGDLYNPELEIELRGEELSDSELQAARVQIERLLGTGKTCGTSTPSLKQIRSW